MGMGFFKGVFVRPASNNEIDQEKGSARALGQGLKMAHHLPELPCYTLESGWQRSRKLGDTV
jgi:hypothetical protein